MDVFSFFHVLIVLTSAIFAIAQYYESRQRKLIENKQESLKNIDFSLAENNEGMRDVKKRWDEIQIVTPIHNQVIIYPLLFLLVIYTVVFLMYVYSDWSMRIFGVELVSTSIVVLKILLLPVLIAVILLPINLGKMNTQIENFDKKAENIFALHQAVSKAINSGK